MAVTTASESWTIFWQEFGPENEPHDRCYVPADGRSALDREWAFFANALPLGAHAIDLGCGAGIVARNLLGHRPDLQMTGIDWARVSAISHPRFAIRTPVNMEAMPFGDGSFDAAVSQFGIEYSDIVETARELARVLRPGAPFCFLTHHRDSAIVREGSMRRRALRELMSGHLKHAFLSGKAPGIAQQKARLRRQYPDEPMVALVSDYFHRNISHTRAERQAIWQKLSDDLDPEIALLRQMERSAKSPTELGMWLVPLLSRMTSVGASVVRCKSGEPIAWLVRGTR